MFDAFYPCGKYRSLFHLTTTIYHFFLPARLGDPWSGVDGKQADKKWLQ
jgi:hypothetical protein